MSKWKVPYIDLGREYEEVPGLLEGIWKVLKSGRYVLGGQVEEFESLMSEYLDVEYVIGLNSGTDALLLALEALEVGSGDEVITVSHTHISTVAAIKHLGATPVLVDVDLDYNMDVSKVREVITERTKVILPVHLNGRACEMELLLNLAFKYHLQIVEDACQALGTKYKEDKAGTFGIGCFSTHPLKVLSSAGDGGFLATDDRKVAEKVRLLRNHGTLDRITHTVWGHNSRLDELQSFVLSRKLAYLDKWVERRREIAQMYNDGLMGSQKVSLPSPPAGGKFYDTYSSYTIRAVQRDRLVQFLNRMGIEVLISWKIPLHLQVGLGLEHYKGKLPVTEAISSEVLSLPIFPQVTDEQVQYVVQCVREFYG